MPTAFQEPDADSTVLERADETATTSVKKMGSKTLSATKKGVMASNNTARPPHLKSLGAEDALRVGDPRNSSQHGASTGARRAAKKSKRNVLGAQVTGVASMNNPPGPSPRTFHDGVAGLEERATKSQKQSHSTAAETSAPFSSSSDSTTLSTPIVVLENKQFWVDEKTGKNFKFGLDHVHKTDADVAEPAGLLCRTLIYDISDQNSNATPITNDSTASLPFHPNPPIGFAPLGQLSEKPKSKDIRGANALLDLMNNPKIFQCTLDAFNAFPRRLAAATDTERTTRPTKIGEERFTRDAAGGNKVFHLGDFYDDDKWKAKPRGFRAALERTTNCSVVKGMKQLNTLITTTGFHRGDFKAPVRTHLRNEFLAHHYSDADRPERFSGGGADHGRVTQWYDSLSQDDQKSFRIFATKTIEARLPKKIRDEVDKLKLHPSLSIDFETPLLKAAGIK